MMTAATTRELAEIGIRLLDEAFQSWESAQLSCDEAFHRWREGPPGRRAAAHAAYRAALDREEAAARDLQRLVQASRAPAAA